MAGPAFPAARWRLAVRRRRREPRNQRTLCGARVGQQSARTGVRRWPGTSRPPPASPRMSLAPRACSGTSAGDVPALLLDCGRGGPGQALNSLTQPCNRQAVWIEAVRSHRPFPCQFSAPWGHMICRSMGPAERVETTSHRVPRMGHEVDHLVRGSGGLGFGNICRSMGPPRCSAASEDAAEACQSRDMQVSGDVVARSVDAPLPSTLERPAESHPPRAWA